MCGRTIIFTETKNDANELAGALSEITGARPLHGDIPQSQREVGSDTWLGLGLLLAGQQAVLGGSCAAAGVCMPAIVHPTNGPSLAELRAPPVGAASFERGPEPRDAQSPGTGRGNNMHRALELAPTYHITAAQLLWQAACCLACVS